MGRFDFETGDAPAQLDGWLSQPGMLGLRLAFNAPDLLPPLLDGRVDWVWMAQPDGRLQRYGVALWNEEEQDEPAPGADRLEDPAEEAAARLDGRLLSAILGVSPPA